jgi:hypothetical protein
MPEHSFEERAAANGHKPDRRGTLGRAPGVQLTFLLNIPLAALVLVLFTRSILG